ncbi:MAG: hypothetical protein AB1611_01215 [bacterium]
MLPSGHFAVGASFAFLANLTVYRIRHYRTTFRHLVVMPVSILFCGFWAFGPDWLRLFCAVLHLPYAYSAEAHQPGWPDIFFFHGFLDAHFSRRGTMLGLVIIIFIFTSLMAIYLLEIWRLRKALKKRGSGVFHFILTAAAILTTVFSMIAGAEATEHGQSTRPLPPPSEQVEVDVQTKERRENTRIKEDTGAKGDLRAQDNTLIESTSILHIGGPLRGLSSSLNLSVEEEYNDNIYRDANIMTSDFITRIRLAVDSSLSGTLGDVKLSYQPQQLLFSRNSDKNELSHEFSASVSTGLDRGITLIRDLVFLDLSDEIGRGHYFSRQEARKGVTGAGVTDGGRTREGETREDDNLFVRRTTKNEFRVHPYIKKRLRRTSDLELGYEYTNTAYSASQATDRESYGGAMILSKAFSRRLSGNVGYRLSKEVASGSALNDYISREAGFGLSNQLGRSLKLTGTGGYNWLTYSSGARDAGAFWSIDLDGTLPLMKVPALSYSFVNSYENSLDSGAVRLRRHSLAGNYQRRTQISWTMFSQKENYREKDWTDESWGIDASLAVPLHKKVDLTLSGGWTASDFEPEDEHLKTHSAGSGILWKISPPLQCAVGFRYSRNDSSLEVNDYRNTTVYVRAGMEL